MRPHFRHAPVCRTAPECLTATIAKIAFCNGEPGCIVSGMRPAVTIRMNHAQSLRADRIHAVLDAIASGQLEQARALLNPAPPELAQVAPGWCEADASVQAAHELYLEALRTRAEVLRTVKERFGNGPFRHEGREVTIVARTRGEAEQLFLRATGAH